MLISILGLAEATTGAGGGVTGYYGRTTGAGVGAGKIAAGCGNGRVGSAAGSGAIYSASAND